MTLSPTTLMAELKRTGRARCFLCGGPPTFLGVWVPTRAASVKLGAPNGKHRVAAYALCRKHRDPGSLACVEARMLADAAVDNARPGEN